MQCKAHQIGKNQTQTHQIWLNANQFLQHAVSIVLFRFSNPLPYQSLSVAGTPAVCICLGHCQSHCADAQFTQTRQPKALPGHSRSSFEPGARMLHDMIGRQPPNVKMKRHQCCPDDFFKKIVHIFQGVIKKLTLKPEFAIDLNLIRPILTDKCCLIRFCNIDSQFCKMFQIQDCSKRETEIMDDRQYQKLSAELIGYAKDAANGLSIDESRMFKIVQDLSESWMGSSYFENAVCDMEEPRFKCKLMNILRWEENRVLKQIDRTESLLLQLIPFQVAALGSFLATSAWAYNQTDNSTLDSIAPIATFIFTYFLTGVRSDFASTSVKLKASARRVKWLIGAVQCTGKTN